MYDSVRGSRPQTHGLRLVKRPLDSATGTSCKPFGCFEKLSRSILYGFLGKMADKWFAKRIVRGHQEPFVSSRMTDALPILASMSKCTPNRRDLPVVSNSVDAKTSNIRELGVEQYRLALSMQNDIALFCSYKATCAARWLIKDTCTNFVQSPWCNHCSEESRCRSSDFSLQGVFSNGGACIIVISYVYSSLLARSRLS